MAIGDIGAVLDQQVFRTTFGYEPTMVNVPGTDIWIIAYHSTGTGVGTLETWTIDPNTGAIGGAFIDQLIFELGNCSAPEVIHIEGNIFAVAYCGPDGDGFVKTFDCDNSGNLGTVIATLEWDPIQGYTRGAGFLNVSGDVYAVAYQGSGTPTSVTTFRIYADGSTSAVLDTWNNGVNQNHAICMAKLADNVFGVVATQLINNARIDTIQITGAGIISAIDFWEFDGPSGTASGCRLITISGTVRAIAYISNVGHHLVTLSIADNGIITKVFIDTNAGPNAGVWGFRRLGGGYYVFTYIAALAWVATWAINDDGTIVGVHDTLSYHAATPAWNYVYRVGIEVWASCYTGPPTNDGVITTFDIDGYYAPAVKTDPATEVT